jgi:uncharacterized repeat protein (TIGR03803 family)
MKLAHVAAVLFAFLTGCGPSWDSHVFLGGSRHAQSIRPSSSYGYATILIFSGTNGEAPFGTLLYHNGVLYGTTYAGGTANLGTVFVAKTGGKERVLHSFGNMGDGQQPLGGVALLNGVFYGTTYGGGRYGHGTVFSITPSGQEKVLHSFRRSDGSRPSGTLTVLNGKLYGTTQSGGMRNGGTVFSITPSGSERVLHSFPPTSPTDGTLPVAGVIDVKGTLYGTTLLSGACSYGYGTVFAITTSGKESILHYFGCTPGDGSEPDAGLVAVKNVLYGTTLYGGYPQGGYNGGTVFRLTLGGQEKVLYSFGSQSVGSHPDAGLSPINGTLYGVTESGGTYAFGTVFRVDTAGNENVLHSFGPEPDGEQPFAALTNVNGTLYGTAFAGGSNYGTIYKISP